jgi:hypothetical protein
MAEKHLPKRLCILLLGLLKAAAQLASEWCCTRAAEISSWKRALLLRARQWITSGQPSGGLHSFWVPVGSHRISIESDFQQSNQTKNRLSRLSFQIGILLADANAIHAEHHFEAAKRSSPKWWLWSQTKQTKQTNTNIRVEFLLSFQGANQAKCLNRTISIALPEEQRACERRLKTAGKQIVYGDERWWA